MAPPGISSKILSVVFGIFNTSLDTAVLRNSKPLIALFLLIPKIQLIALGFMPQVVRVLKAAASFVNFGILGEGLSPKRLIFTKTAVMGGLFIFILALIFLILRFEEVYRQQHKKKMKIGTRLKNLILVSFLVIRSVFAYPAITLLSLRLSCMFHSSKIASKAPHEHISGFGAKEEGERLYECPEINGMLIPASFFQILNAFFLVCFILFIYIVQNFDFDSRIKNLTFGQRNNNRTQASSFLADILTLLSLEALGKQVPLFSILLACILQLLSYSILKSSTTFICPRYKRIVLSYSCMVLWYYLAFSVTALSKILYGKDYLIMFGISFVLLIISLMLKKTENDMDLLPKKCSKLKSARNCIVKLELLLRIYHIKLADLEHRSRMIFDGFYELLIREGEKKAKEEAKTLDENLCSMKTIKSNDKEDEETLLVKKEELAEANGMKKYFLNEYLRSIKRFPEDIDLKISFIYYLVDFTEYCNLALQHLESLKHKQRHSKHKFALHQRLQINRLEKIVEEAVLEKSKLHSSQSTKKEEEEEKKSLIDKKNEKSKTKKNTNPMRLGEPGELESSILQMRINKSIIQSTKKASYSYCILWRALLLDQPEIQATEHLLDEAYKRIRRAEGVWERAQSFRFTGFEAQKFYAMYLIQVLLRKDEGIEILRDFYKKRWKEFQRKAKIQNFEADTKMEEFSDPVFYIKTNEKGVIVMGNCSLEFCQKIRYKKSEIVNEILSKFVDDRAVRFYKKYLKGSVKPEKNKFYKYIAITQSHGSLDFFSAKVKLISLNESETGLVVKLMPKIHSRLTAKIMIDRKFRVWGNNSHCMALFGLESCSPKELGYKKLTSLIPGISKVMDEKKIKFDKLCLLESREFSSKLVIHPKKTKTKEMKFRLKLVKLDDTRQYLVKVWKAEEGEEAHLSTHLTFLKKTSRSRRFGISAAAMSQFEFTLTRDCSFLGRNVDAHSKILDSKMNSGVVVRGRRKVSLGRMSTKNLEEQEGGTESDKGTSSIFLYNRRRLTKGSGKDGGVDYSSGIITRRLLNGFLISVEDDEGVLGEVSERKKKKGEGKSTKVLGGKAKRRGGKGARIGVAKRTMNFGYQSSFFGEGFSQYFSSQRRVDLMISRRMNSLAWPAYKFMLGAFFFSILSVLALLMVLRLHENDLNIVKQLSRLERLEMDIEVGTEAIYSSLIDLSLKTQEEGLNPARNLKFGFQAETRGILASIEFWVARVTQNNLKRQKLISRYFKKSESRQNRPMQPSIDQETKIQSQPESTSPEGIKHAIETVVALTHKQITLAKEDPVNALNLSTNTTKLLISKIQALNRGLQQETLGIESSQEKTLSSSIEHNLAIRISLTVFDVLLALAGCLAVIWLITLEERSIESFYGFEDDYMKKIVQNGRKYIEFINKIQFFSLPQNQSKKGRSEEGEKQSSIGAITRLKDPLLDLEFQRRLDSPCFSGNRNFIQLKKRKKKGSLRKVCRCWQVVFVGFAMSMQLINLTQGQIFAFQFRSVVGLTGYLEILKRMQLAPFGVRNHILRALVLPDELKRDLLGSGFQEQANEFYDRFGGLVKELSKMTHDFSTRNVSLEAVITNTFGEDACKELHGSFLSSEVSVGDTRSFCDLFQDGILKNGLLIALQQLDTDILHLFQRSKMIGPSSSLDVTDDDNEVDCEQVASQSSQAVDNQQKSTKCLLRSSQFIHLSQFAQIFGISLFNNLQKLLEIELEEIENQYQDYSSLTVISCCSVCVFGLFILAFYSKQFNSKVKSIQYMMRFHDPSQIGRNQKMRRYLLG